MSNSKKFTPKKNPPLEEPRRNTHPKNSSKSKPVEEYDLDSASDIERKITQLQRQRDLKRKAAIPELQVLEIDELEDETVYDSDSTDDYDNNVEEEPLARKRSKITASVAYPSSSKAPRQAPALTPVSQQLSTVAANAIHQLQTITDKKSRANGTK